MLAGVVFSEREGPADFGRLERTLLDAGRRGVAGTGFMSFDQDNFRRGRCVRDDVPRIVASALQESGLRRKVARGAKTGWHREMSRLILGSRVTFASISSQSTVVHLLYAKGE